MQAILIDMPIGIICIYYTISLIIVQDGYMKLLIKNALTGTMILFVLSLFEGSSFMDLLLSYNYQNLVVVGVVL